ncbi:MAG: ParB/RepB/Spo0J family partition protein [Phycisphaerales bacterium]|nr:ParB/RepB/Spo0J family partition protein [Phycisphaerales bacterium]
MAKASERPARRRLGRGLDSLLNRPVELDATPSTTHAHDTTPDGSPAVSAPVDASAAVAPHDDQPRLVALPVESLRPNARQPRQTFDPTALDALAASIRAAGVMQPVIVRPADADGRHELVAGERRWRAARLIDLPTIPAIIQNVDDQLAAELALIENLQREDLNPMDRAVAFQRLVDDFGLTHQALADRVGISRAAVTNLMRLTELGEYPAAAVRAGTLTLGHAKVLLQIHDRAAQRQLAEQTMRHDWSVRVLEERVRTLLDPAPGPSRAARSAPTPHMADLERRLGDHLKTKVHVRAGRKKGSGTLQIEFYDLDHFEGLLERFGFDSA